MATGTVKWYDPVKGYGYIIPDDGGEDILVQYPGILEGTGGLKYLTAGERVQFDVAGDSETLKR